MIELDSEKQQEAGIGEREKLLKMGIVIGDRCELWLQQQGVEKE